MELSDRGAKCPMQANTDVRLKNRKILKLMTQTTQATTGTARARRP
jgi:hypothetical protein